MTGWMGADIPGWVLVIVALGVVALVSRKPFSRSRDGSRAGGKAGNTAARVPPVSDAARDVARRLGLAVGVGQRRLPVTICVNNVVLKKEEDDHWSPIQDALRVVALLNEVASVFLVASVETDEEETEVKQLAMSTGLILPAGDSRNVGIIEHRLLFCSSHVGQVAVVRQLRSSLHIGGSVAFLGEISRFVPSLVRVDSDVVVPPLGQACLGEEQGSSGANCLGWREFTSLAEAGGIPSPVSSPVEETATTKVETVVENVTTTTVGSAMVDTAVDSSSDREGSAALPLAGLVSSLPSPSNT